MNAYECDTCGKFFPGQPHQRYLPKPKVGYEDKGTTLQLCKSCADEFDRRMYEINQTFTFAALKRKGNVRNDTGHTEG